MSISSDFQKLDSIEGKKIINIMIKYQNKNSILEHFEYYDIRQANYDNFINSNINKIDNIIPQNIKNK